MSRLADYMNEPSTGLEDYTDGETKLTVYDGTDAELTEATAELAEAEIEQNEIHQDGEALREAQTAMEAYYDALQSSLEDGGLDRQGAAILKIGVERYEKALGIDESPLPALESYGGASSQYTATTVSVEGLKETLAKIMQMLKNVVKAIVAATKDFYHKVTNATDKIEKKADQLIAAAKKTNDSQGNVTVSNSKLFADGEFRGDKATELLGVATYIYTVYPNDAFAYMDAYGQALTKLDPTADDFPSKAAEMLTGQTALNSPFAKFPGDEIDSSKDNRFSNQSHVKKTITLPNNKAVFITYPDMKSDKDVAAVLATNAKMKLADDVTAKDAPKTHDVKALNMGDVIRQCEAIKKLCGTMGKLDPAKVNKAAEDLLKQVEAFSKKVEDAEGKGDLPAGNKTVVNSLMRGASTMQDLLGNSMAGVSSYFVQEMMAYLAFYQRCYAVAAGKDATDE